VIDSSEPSGPSPHEPPAPRATPLEQLEARAGETAPESAQLFDWALIGSYALFVLHSLRRHKLLFLIVWVGIVAFSLALMVCMPKTYRVQATLQAQRNTVMPALSNPGRAIPVEADTPTRQAAETVQRYDNLVALIQQTDLLEIWPLRRAPLLRLKDFFWRRLFRAPTRDEQIVSFAYYLRDKLWVATPEGTVTIGIEFPDGELAYRLVDAAVENFLEARHAADVSSISEAITILEARAEQARQALETSVQQLQTVRDERSRGSGKRVRSRAALEVRPPAVPDEETSRLLLAVQTKRRAIADLEEFRRRRVTELETKLQEQRAIYSENHPIILDIEQSLAAVRQESPQVAALKTEVASLEAELTKKGIAKDAPEHEVRRPTRVVIPAERLHPADPHEDEDAQIEYMKEQVNFALSKYNSLLDRIDSAQLELDSARAAFKYRYTIVLPAQKPRYANKPNPTLVFGGSLVAGFVLALLTTAIVDLRSRKLLEKWQVERALKTTLIGEVRST
jgi:uncharacterized protein involved in exopolysaccharide biosynthesis